MLAANPNFPGADPNESVRINTPDDPEFDRCEPHESGEGSQTCTNTFDQEIERFGFAPNGSQGTALYKPPFDWHVTRLQAQNTTAGRNAAGQLSGVSADRAWKRSIGDPEVQVAILDTGIRWNNRSLRKKVALNAGELPPPQKAGGAECDDDCNADGAFDVDDFAADPRVQIDEGHNEADAFLDPSDLIAEFGQAGGDDDGNGYVNDIAGWDFFDDDNDPYDASSYSSSGNHGTGRAEEAAAQTNDDDDGTGVCPRCQVIPMRIWDTFVADTNNFAQAAVYAADNDIEVVEGAIGGLVNSRFSREAFEHAYRQGVFFAIVSSDLNTANHNIPTLYNESMMVAGTVADVHGLGENPPQQFVDFFTGLGLPLATTMPIGTWFRNSGTTQYGGHGHVVMTAVTGSAATGQASGAAGLMASAGRELPSPLEPNEIKQLFTMTAEDVVPQNTTGLGVPDPAQVGWDQHFGYGRPDLGLALERIEDNKIPPQALITSPEWFAPHNVERQGSVEIRGRLSAKRAGGFSWQLQWAPGIEPAETDFQDVGPQHNATSAVDGPLGTIDLADVRAALDARPGGGATTDPTAPAKGPGDTDPNEPAFTVRVVVCSGPGDTDCTAEDANRGEDRKVLFAYRDTSLHEGWAKELGTGGDQSQRLWDLNGDNALDVIQPTDSGELRVLQADGSPLSSFNGGDPVRTRTYANAHPGAPSIAALGPPREVVTTPAIGDIDGDLKPEIVATAGEHIYAWNDDGSEVRGFPRRLDPTKSLPQDRTRNNHVKRGFMGSAVLADLTGGPALEVVAAALDQHVYAVDGGGDDLLNFPKKLKDPTENLAGAEIVNTPAVGDIAGDDRPEIVVPSAEFDPNPSAPTTPSGGSALGGFGNIVTNVAASQLGGSGRVYALGADGNILSGWPTKPNGVVPDALPLVGPGVDHVMANVDGDSKLEAIGNVASGELTATDGDGTNAVIYDSQPPGGEHADKSKVMHLFEHPIAANLDGAPGTEVMKGGVTLNQLINIGVAVGQNLPYNHVVTAWNGESGGAIPTFPQAVEDYQLLSSPVVGDVSTLPGNEMLVGTGLYLLRNINAAGVEAPGWPKFTGGWLAAVPAVGDADGDGQLEVVAQTREGWAFLWDTDRPACSDNDEWWTARHDERNTGAYGVDSRPPGTPTSLRGDRSGSRLALSWTAPGDDWLCGKASRYRVLTSQNTITGPEDGTVLGEFDATASGGEEETRSVDLPATTRSHGGTHVAVVYRDEAGNWGRPADVQLARLAAGGGPGGAPGGSAPAPGSGGVLGRQRGTRCLPRRLRVSGRRIGPARIGSRMSAFRRRYRVVERSRVALRFCVRGGGRFLVSSRRGRIDLVATTARGHRTRRTGPARRRGRLPGARRLGRGVFVGRRVGRGRVVYGLGRARVRYLAVASRRQVRHRVALLRRLRALGLR